MDIQTLIYNVLKDLITLGATVLLGYLTAYAKSHFSGKQLSNAIAVATLAVTFAEQVAKSLDLSSIGKFNAALEQAKSLAAKYGLNYTDEQWKGLIEAALKEAQKDWQELAAPIQTQATSTIQDCTVISDNQPPITTS